MADPKTNWSVSVTFSLFETEVTISNSSELPKRFELAEPVNLTKDKVIAGLQKADIEVPEDIKKLIPGPTAITRFLVDREKKAFAFSIKIDFDDEFILNKYPELFTLDQFALTIDRSEAEETPAD